MYLKAIDQPKLRKDSVIVMKLGIFVRTTIKTVLNAIKIQEDTQKAIKK